MGSKNKQKIHICLVSAQLLANIIPILMDRPSIVILISTKTMEDNGILKRFKQILDSANIKYDVYPDMPSTDMPKIYDFALETSEDIQDKYSDFHLILNATCGTKLMSQGFIEVMDKDADIIYTDTQHKRLEYLGNIKKEAIGLKNVLDIQTYFKAYGAKYKRSESDDENWINLINSRKKVTKYLGQNIESIQGLISNLNYLVNEHALAEDGLLVKPIQYLNTKPRKEWCAALKKLNDAGLLKWEKGTEITFIDEDKVRYLSGIWLEEYVYHIAKDESPNDIKSGVKISWENSQKTHNEFDLVVVHNNRMLIIECKTMRYGENIQKDTDILYKIDSLGNELKGLYGSLWLVNAQESHANMQDRAKDRNITIIEPSNLKNLRDNIRKWMGDK